MCNVMSEQLVLFSDPHGTPVMLHMYTMGCRECNMNTQTSLAR